MALGTQDKEPRGFYSQANADLSAPLNTRPTQASRQTTNAMDQQLRGMPSPLGMPKGATPAAPAAAGPITQMSQAAADNYTNSPERAAWLKTIPSEMPRPAQPPAAPATPRTYAEPVIRPDVLQRFAELQSLNMGIQLQGRDYGSPLPTQQAPANPLAGMRVSDTSAPDIKRIDGGSSPLFTNIDPAQAVLEMRGGTVSTLPASAFTNPSPSDSAAIYDALQAAAARGDFGAVRDYYQRDGGTWQGRTAEQDREAALIKQAQELLAGKSRTGRQQGAGLLQQLMQLQQSREQAAAQSAADAPAREGQQLQNQQAQMMMDLTRKAIGGDQEALKQLQALQGKNPKTPQSEALLEFLKAYTAGQATALPGSGVPIGQVLKDAGPLLQMLGVQMPAADPVGPPAPETVIDGYRFKGGNPADPKSWEKA